jgi:hypothetical protein
MKHNYRTAPKPAIAPEQKSERDWRGFGDSERSAFARSGIK